MEKVKVLIVEDEAIVALDLKYQLTEIGYSVLDMVPTGEDALIRTEEYGPDLLLIDIMLKGNLDGIDTAAKIRSESDVPIIFISAYSEESIVERAKSTRPSGYLMKPVSNMELYAAIQSALKKDGHERRIENGNADHENLLKENSDAVF